MDGLLGVILFNCNWLERLIRCFEVSSRKGSKGQELTRGNDFTFPLCRAARFLGKKPKDPCLHWVKKLK